MRMLKGDSSALNFDQLMAQATQIAKQQDASLMERARQKRREDEERRRREDRATREREEAQAQLMRKRELELKQKKATKTLEKKRPTASTTAASTKARSTTSSVKKASSVANNAFNYFPEKKKPVHMSFEDLMKKAKEQSAGKPKDKAALPPKKYTSHDTSIKSTDNTPTLYHRIKRPEASQSTPIATSDSMSARDRAKLLISEPPKKLNLQKRDRRSIADIQREIRHSKGIHSDEEVDDRTRKDPRLMKNRTQQQPKPLAKRPMSPPRANRPEKRPPASAAAIDRRAGPPPVRRMPFSGRRLDGPASRRPPPRRRYRDEEEEEEDEELASFIVDDEEVGDYSRGPRRNSYSDEISKIFRYDKNRYANDPVYSDDDMEADASDVLREEKRSERIARREDLLEEQKELERLKRRKKGGA